MTLTEGPTDWEVDPWDSPAASGSVERLRRDTRAVKWAVWIVMVVVVVLVLVAGRIGWWYVKQINPEGTPEAPVSFTVNDGDTLESVSERLEAQGIIVNAGVFRWYVEEKGGLELTPGYYQLRPADHIGNIVGTLRTPPAETYTKITFPEGFTIAQMAARLAESTERMTAAEFVTAANEPAVVSTFRPAGVTSLEGLLFPDTYQVSNGENEAQVVERMVSLMERVGLQEDLEAGAADLGYTPYQILIIASMIEREAKLPEDRAKIARVIYNRLGPFSPYPQLQIDATLLYNQDPALSIGELRQIDTPYNTYMYSGLPPTPIANPGRASIHAALHPAPNPPSGDPVCQELPDPTNCPIYFYVLANEDGGHVFAVTPEQHERNVAAARAAGLLG
ncbi:MAG TPA: endolytic transglycosylase MltG [Ilumatobacteraceae bacterium]|nr:endolytic transglycosylase MltG [Ilumatobacteraceae bacterium]